MKDNVVTMRWIAFLLCACVLIAQQTRPNQQDPNPGGVPLFKDKPPSKEEGPSRVVRGAVVDEAGAPVAGAVVKLEDSKTGNGRNALTPKDGTWMFDGICWTLSLSRLMARP